MVGLTFMFGLVNHPFLSQNPPPPPSNPPNCSVLNKLTVAGKTILNIYQKILTL